MPSRLPVALICLLVVVAAGCRQADGPIPTPDREQGNEIGDLARDMINVVNKDPQGPEELRSDLAKYGDNAEQSAIIDALSRDVTAALAGARLEDPTAQALAHSLWVGLTAKQMSVRQTEALGNELKTVLATAGVAEERAQPVVDRLGEVQKAITQNPKRWYQVF